MIPIPLAPFQETRADFSRAGRTPSSSWSGASPVEDGATPRFLLEGFEAGSRGARERGTDRAGPGLARPRRRAKSPFSRRQGSRSSRRPRTSSRASRASKSPEGILAVARAALAGHCHPGRRRRHPRLRRYPGPREYLGRPCPRRGRRRGAGPGSLERFGGSLLPQGASRLDGKPAARSGLRRRRPGVACRRWVSASRRSSRRAGRTSATPTGRLRSRLVLGREASGLDDSAVAAADMRVTIPMQGALESLNVATAAAVVLYEANRRMLGR